MWSPSTDHSWVSKPESGKRTKAYAGQARDVENVDGNRNLTAFLPFPSPANPDVRLTAGIEPTASEGMERHLFGLPTSLSEATCQI